MEYVEQMNDILKSFKIKASCIGYEKNDNYAFYDLTLLPSAKVLDVKRFVDEISMALKAPGKPSLKVIHEKGVVRLEFVTKRTSQLNLFEYFAVDNDVPDGEIVCLLGQDIFGKRVWMDLAKNPHMIIAGTTGSGKTTLVHNIIANILNYNQTFLFLIDPKRIEFVEYDETNLKNVKVGYSYKESLDVLDTLLSVMDFRYDILRKGTPVSHIPNIVLIIDEFADLIMQDVDNQFYTKLCRLAQKCRAAKISIILSTQRPTVDIINGTIKANFPVRIACKVSSHVDSKVILDAVGAEHLLGRGDALLRDHLRYLERFQIAYTDASEVCNFFGKLNEQY